MANLKNGDVVQLKSNGPAMTIQEIRDDGIALCVWFDGKTRFEGVFKLDNLTTENPRDIKL